MYRIVLLTFFYITQFSNSARILGVVPSPSYSHQIVFHPLWRELSLRGHQVTVLTTDPINDPTLTNLTEIDLHFSYEPWDKNMQNISQENAFNSMNLVVASVKAAMELQLQHPPVQALISNKSKHFDLVMVELLMPTMLAFSERFKCPAIAMTSTEAPDFTYEAVGNPVHPVLYPEFIFPFYGELTFFERLISSLFYLFGHAVGRSYLHSMEELTIQKYFGNNYPPIPEIQKRISMLFVNSNPIFDRIRPLVPAVVTIGGGTHRKPPKSLPKELQKLLDGASNGFIYFSLGSNVKSKDLPKDVLQTLLETFADLPYLVLWKFEAENLPGKPKNVVISKWFPQQDVLRHSNSKLFITQGGLQSMEEAIYNHVPMVVMPFFADQPFNARKMVSNGMGLSVDSANLDKKAFTNTILDVIQNPKYRNKIKELAELALDQPMAGLEKAIWWTEYVLRHKGAKHLRSPSLDLPLYQYLLLDVIGFCSLVVVTFVYLFVKLIKLIRRLIKYMVHKPKVKVQ